MPAIARPTSESTEQDLAQNQNAERLPKRDGVRAEYHWTKPVPQTLDDKP
jgi:hypothetical protein